MEKTLTDEVSDSDEIVAGEPEIVEETPVLSMTGSSTTKSSSSTSSSSSSLIPAFKDVKKKKKKSIRSSSTLDLQRPSTGRRASTSTTSSGSSSPLTVDPIEKKKGKKKRKSKRKPLTRYASEIGFSNRRVVRRSDGRSKKKLKHRHSKWLDVRAKTTDDFELVEYSDNYEIENTNNFNWFDIHNEENLKIKDTSIYSNQFAECEHINFVGNHTTGGPFVVSILRHDKGEGFKCLIRTVDDDRVIVMSPDRIPKRAKDWKKALIEHDDFFEQAKMKKIKKYTLISDLVGLETKIV